MQPDLLTIRNIKGLLLAQSGSSCSSHCMMRDESSQHNAKRLQRAALQMIFPLKKRVSTYRVEGRVVKSGELNIFDPGASFKFKEPPPLRMIRLVKKGNSHLAKYFEMEIMDLRGVILKVIELNRDVLAAISLATHKKKDSGILRGRKTLSTYLVLFLKDSKAPDSQPFTMFALRGSRDSHTLEAWRTTIKEAVFHHSYSAKHLLRDRNNCTYVLHSTTEFVTLIPDDPACSTLQELLEKTRVLCKTDLRVKDCGDDVIRLELDDHSFSENFEITAGSKVKLIVNELERTRSYISRDASAPLPAIPTMLPTVGKYQGSAWPFSRSADSFMIAPTSATDRTPSPTLSQASSGGMSPPTLSKVSGGTSPRLPRPPAKLPASSPVPPPRTPSPCASPQTAHRNLVYKTTSSEAGYVNGIFTDDRSRSNSGPPFGSKQSGTQSLPRNKPPKPAPRKPVSADASTHIIPKLTYDLSANTMETDSNCSIIEHLSTSVPASNTTPVQTRKKPLQRQHKIIVSDWQVAEIDIQKDKTQLDCFRQIRRQKCLESRQNRRLTTFMEKYIYANGEDYTNLDVNQVTDINDEDDIYADVRECRLPYIEPTEVQPSPPSKSGSIEFDSIETTLYDILFHVAPPSPDPFNLDNTERTKLCLRLHLLESSIVDGGWETFAQNVMNLSVDEIRMIDGFSAFHNYPVLEIVLRHWHNLQYRNPGKVILAPTKQNIIAVLQKMKKYALLEAINWPYS